jgi:hypothetical protein
MSFTIIDTTDTLHEAALAVLAGDTTITPNPVDEKSDEIAALGPASKITSETAVAFLNTKIHIPMISDLLRKIGLPDLFMLDGRHGLYRSVDACATSPSITGP